MMFDWTRAAVRAKAFHRVQRLRLAGMRDYSQSAQHPLDAIGGRLWATHPWTR